MSTIVEFTHENLGEILDLLCECGHKLSYHGFVDGTYAIDDMFFYVSQCMFCDYDYEKDEYTCKEFKSATEDDK